MQNPKLCSYLETFLVCAMEDETLPQSRFFLGRNQALHFCPFLWISPFSRESPVDINDIYLQVVKAE